MTENKNTVITADVSPIKPKPIIFVPSRGSTESIFINGSGPGFSPGPMTMLSGFFSEQSNSPFSFSQLLAMASPLPAKNGSLLSNNDNDKDCEKESKCSESQTDLHMGFEGLSPLFMASSCGFLDSPLQSPFGMSHQQALAHVTAQAVFSQSYMQMQTELQCSYPTAPVELFHTRSSAPNESLAHQTKIKTTEPDIIKFESSEASRSDTKGNKPESDGYNWRKYGQKHVKARECPRSYYKCTYINCPVKKIVEQSLDGRISELTYKGHHNHDLPQNTKRGKDIGALSRPVISQVNSDFAPVQNETDRANEQEPLEPQHIDSSIVDIQDTNKTILDDRDNDEPTAKRRMMDVGPSKPVSSYQNLTEPKIVVQTRSEVDYLDDGFKWRKYGQKVVKGNPHPRSYYRCTYAECNVRKHVERASEDPKAVITTYEGKHTHEIPAGRYSINGSSEQLQTQRIVPATSRPVKEIDLENNDLVPMTLQLKGEQIAA